MLQIADSASSLIAPIALLIILFIIVVFAAIVIGLVLPLLALVEVWTSKKESEWKLIWTLIIIAGSIVGLVVYFVFGRKELKTKKAKK
ncbi:PLDc N-terminal domain-containing protein [Candidatus Micrarchaeota archaeon]|nr:PLDc N-terminal domain-containing protein [Candidatus Micrarchaeota archaeon]